MTGDGSEKILDVIISSADITTGQEGRQGPRLVHNAAYVNLQTLRREQMWRIFRNDKYPLAWAVEEDGCHD